MKEPMRILHVFGRLDAGGAESRTMDIYRNINREKVQFDFAIHTNDKCYFTEEIKRLGGKIYNFPRFNGSNYFEYKNTWETFFNKHKEYKIIHGHQTSTGFIYFKIAKKYKVPIRIAHARNSNKDSMIKKYTTRLAKMYVTHKFAVSELAAISEFGKLPVEKKEVEIIPNAIDIKKYIFNPKIRSNKRKELGFNNETIIIHIGRFHPQKNHEFLLDIFNQYKKKDPSANLLLIGSGFLKDKIIEKAKNSDFKESVHFLGARNDIEELMLAADILVFPSLFEGLPGVVLEAQASGLPCVISDSITKEVKLTDLVEYVSLDENEKKWGDIIRKNISKKTRRNNTYEKMKKAGYDIKEVAKWYEEFYIHSQSKF